ncbi:hypothetical protein Acr_03g0017860 [Actinidia rufa]|uniref:Retrovirus-related Pol polyprotein from transposon TNT 1-94-like beta-barrel domain-containing protein n=1 Tax=Actinidia rufa TaxID=165716 RepID=A0A7J0EF87_9ERIC|nr:hypothetical protein Acr_03g0017860 [Actinidia rufa]
MQHARDVYGWRTTQLAELLAEGQSGSAWTDGRSVTLTEVRHVPNLRKNLISIGMLDAKGCSLTLVEEFSEFPRETRRCCGERRLEGYTDWRRMSRQEELLSDMGPVVLARRVDKGSNLLHRGTQSKRRGTWRIRSGTRAQGDALGYVQKSGQTRVMQPVQDVHREAQRKETKSILRSCTAKGAATPKRVSFALDLISGGVLSSCAHKGGEMEPRQLAK